MLNTDMCLFYQGNRLHAKCMSEEHGGKTRNRKFCKKYEKKGHFVNAKTDDCCAWTQHRVLEKRGILKDEDFCGLSDETYNSIIKTRWSKFKKKTGFKHSKKEFMRDKCCADEGLNSFGDCDSFDWPKGPAMNRILDYGGSNDIFYKDYLKAWKFATENGFTLKSLE